MKIIHNKRKSVLSQSLVAIPIGLALSFVTTIAMAQQPPAPNNPPPPPPSPKELFNKINPFKKDKKEVKSAKTSKEKVSNANAGPQLTPPPPPPNPMDLFKKKKSTGKKPV